MNFVQFAMTGCIPGALKGSVGGGGGWGDVDALMLEGGSQWGGGFYGYWLKFWLFYGCRLIFFQLRLTKKLKINFFLFQKVKY